MAAQTRASNNLKQLSVYRGGWLGDLKMQIGPWQEGKNLATVGVLRSLQAVCRAGRRGFCGKKPNITLSRFVLFCLLLESCCCCCRVGFWPGAHLSCPSSRAEQEHLGKHLSMNRATGRFNPALSASSFPVLQQALPWVSLCIPTAVIPCPFYNLSTAAGEHGPASKFLFFS